MKKRIALCRIVIILAIIASGYFGINPPGFVAEVVAFAFGLAAASFFPVILLGIFDKMDESRRSDNGNVSWIDRDFDLHHSREVCQN